MNLNKKFTRETRTVNEAVPVTVLAIIVLLIAVSALRSELFVHPDKVQLASVYSSEITASLAQMVGKAELVVLGRYAGYDSSWNMSGGTDEPPMDDAGEYVEGRLYAFNVENFYKGECGSEILVNHRYGEKVLSQLDHVSYFMLADPLFSEPQIGEQYVLCLRGCYRYDRILQ